MAFSSAIARIFALAIAATAVLTGGAARADSIYTVTATGVIDDAGQDYGIFGNPYGTDLTGQTFTITESFDLDQSTLNQGDQNEDLSPATVFATVSVGGVTVSINSTGMQNTLYLDHQAHATGDGQSSPIYSAVQGDAFYAQLQVFNGGFDVIDTLDSIGLDKDYFITFMAGITGQFYFQGSDNSYIYGSLLTLQLQAPQERIELGQAAPEPASLASFLLGLAALAWLRRQAICRAIPARRAAAWG
jgi:hypothetical protein